jgi:hypothetical protein
MITCFIGGVREQAVQWLKDNYKENFAPKKKQKEGANIPPTKKRKMDMDSDFCDDEEEEEAEINVPQISEYDLSEVEGYLSVPQLSEGMSFDILDWRKRKKDVCPHLVKMVKQFLCNPATSGGVERLFTTSGVCMVTCERALKRRQWSFCLELIKMIKFH